MKRQRSILQAVAFVATLSLAGCGGVMGLEEDPNGPGTGSNTQCPADKMICVGDPDTGALKCQCNDLWDCSKNPVKCTQPTPTPEGAMPAGGNGWECTWTEFKYTCSKKGPPDQNPPPGGSGWSCQYDSEYGGWKCTENPPVPNGASKWSCTVKNGALECVEVTPPPVTGNNTWNCGTDASGKYVCTTGDLPPGGSNWKCSQVTKGGVPTWVCVGDSSGNPAPGGNGWTCAPMENEFNKWKCEKPVDTPPQTPPGGGTYQCVKGTEFGGTKCEEAPKPPPGTSNDLCKINEKMWCDGLQYCGWGQVACDPATGKWKTKVVNGKTIHDCQELSNGARPNTVCACYHFFFNPACCERPDCLVPSGSTPQICGPSQGGLCDYCNPMQSECKNNGKCIVTNNHETFCGQPCSTTQPCPANYNCMTVKTQVGTVNQCVPADFSCYF